jgi:hypothetical protein
MSYRRYDRFEKKVKNIDVKEILIRRMIMLYLSISINNITSVRR